MKQHIFFEILKKLNKDEIKRFGDFLHSPFFNTRKSLIKLYELSMQSIKNDNASLISKQNISACIHSDNKKISDETVRRLLSDFTILLDKFLIQLEFEKNEMSQKAFLAENLKKLGIEPRFRQKINEAKQKLEKSVTRDEKFYLDKISLLQSQAEFSREFTPNVISEIDQQINDAFDNFFILNKLYQFQVFYSNQYIHKERQYNWTFFDQIRTFIEENLETIKKDNPEIFLRYKMLILLLNPQNKSIIDECIAYIEDVKKTRAVKIDSYYIDILNLCSLMINSGDSGYNDKIVQISKDMESNKAWDNFHFVHYDLAKIIIESAITGKELLWAKNFTLFIANKIEPKFKDSFINLMLAKLFFFSRDYGNAKIHQSKVHYEDFIFYTDAKGIEARIEFETEDYSRAIEAIESLKKYLKSHKGIPDNWNISFSRFANSLAELIKYTEKKNIGTDLFEIENIKNEIKNSGLYVYGTDWLLDKFDTLSKK